MVAIQMLYLRTMESLRTLRDEEDGQGLVEYALILALVGVVLTAFLTGVADTVGDVFNEIISELGGTEVSGEAE